MVYYLIVSNVDSVKENKNLKIIKRDGNKMIIAITRWASFTTEIIKLSNQDLKIYEISGNDEISVSTITRNQQEIYSSDIKFLYQSKIVTNDSLKRNLYFLPVGKLLPFIKNVIRTKGKVEHVYDY